MEAGMLSKLSILIFSLIFSFFSVFSVQSQVEMYSSNLTDEDENKKECDKFPTLMEKLTCEHGAATLKLRTKIPTAYEYFYWAENNSHGVASFEQLSKELDNYYTSFEK
jgi:hypothetical protein